MQATRTVQVAPVQSKFSGKWACTFQTFATFGSEEHQMGEVETAAVWFDAEAAKLAGERALQTLKETNRYPNMCEVW